MPECPAIEMTFCGNSSAEVTRHICEFAALHGGDPIANASTEALLKELRDRLAKNGQVVKVVPFENEENSSAASTVEGSSTPPTTRGRGRPRKVVEEVAKPTETPAPAETVAEVVEEPAGDGAKTVEEAPATSIDEVKQALNEFAALYGQVAARKIMSEQGGSTALKDVPAEKYGAVVKGLREYKPVAQAA